MRSEQRKRRRHAKKVASRQGESCSNSCECTSCVLFGYVAHCPVSDCPIVRLESFGCIWNSNEIAILLLLLISLIHALSSLLPPLSSPSPSFLSFPVSLYFSSSPLMPFILPSAHICAFRFLVFSSLLILQIFVLIVSLYVCECVWQCVCLVCLCISHSSCYFLRSCLARLSQCQLQFQLQIQSQLRPQLSFLHWMYPSRIWMSVMHVYNIVTPTPFRLSFDLWKYYFNLSLSLSVTPLNKLCSNRSESLINSSSRVGEFLLPA